MTSARTSENPPAKGRFSLRPPTSGGPRVRNQSDRTQTNKATVETKKTCKCRPFRKRLKGFEPSTFCMASSRSAAPRVQKCLQIGVSGRVDRAFAVQELCADAGGLDNERTMSDTDGGRTSDEVAAWSSQSPPGFERQPASWPLPLRLALAERFPADIDGGEGDRTDLAVDGQRATRRPLSTSRASTPHRPSRARRRTGSPAASRPG
jgi:hypothetical protein